MFVVSSRCHRNHRTRCHSTFWTAMRVHFRQWSRICQPHNRAVLQKVWHRAPSHTSVRTSQANGLVERANATWVNTLKKLAFRNSHCCEFLKAQCIAGNQHRRAKLHRILSIFSFARVSASPPEGTSHRNYNIGRLPRGSTRHFARCTDQCYHEPPPVSPCKQATL
ncbi:unnamed protein product [Ixodes persulcatus]